MAISASRSSGLCISPSAFCGAITSGNFSDSRSARRSARSSFTRAETSGFSSARRSSAEAIIRSEGSTPTTVAPAEASSHGMRPFAQPSTSTGPPCWEAWRW